MSFPVAPKMPLLTRLLLAALLVLSTGASAATFVVNSTADTVDDDPGDGDCSTGNVIVVSTVPLVLATECTFRAALLEANARAGADTVEFSGILPTVGGVVEFFPGSAYPPVEDTLVIDGYSHPSYDDADPDAVPTINLRGTSVGGTSAALRFLAGADDAVVRGLAISGFPGTAIYIGGTFVAPGPSGVIVEGNHLGVWRGAFYVGNGNHGVAIAHADGNTIGLRCNTVDGCLGKRNIISSNPNDGIRLVDADANVIAGNYIGTDRTGTATSVPFGGSTRNGGSGIELDANSSGNLIGSTGAFFAGGEFVFVSGGNLVSGNDRYGIRIDGGSNTVYSNKIGTNVSGTGALGNGLSGIYIEGDVNAVGGSFPLEGNLISGNGDWGVIVNRALSPAPVSCSIRFNTIGLNANRDAALGNDAHGLLLEGSNHVIEYNHIGGNVGGGIAEGFGVENVGLLIRGNVIGTNEAGDDLGNGGAGISLAGAGHVIGGAGEGNVVGFNGFGIVASDSSSDFEIHGNFIGTNALGDDLGNDGQGLLIYGQNHDVGAFDGRANGLGNTVGFNEDHGIRIQGSQVRVQGNYVGTNAAGDDLGNALAGIYASALFFEVALGSAIGAELGAPAGDVALAGNVVSYNEGGIVLEGSPVEVAIRGNQLFANEGPGIDLGWDGETPNDPDDLDAGANRLQNFPVFDPAETFYDPVSGEMTVRFAVDSVARTTSLPLTVDLYLHDPWLHPGDEAASYLGAVAYDPVVAGSFVTAKFTPEAGSLPANAFGDVFGGLRGTATDSNGNTSELSRQSVPVPEPGYLAGLFAGILGLATASPCARTRARRAGR